MRDMMGAGTGAWLLLWVIVGLVIAVAAGVVVDSALKVRAKYYRAQVGSAEPPATQAARDALRLRYAKGEIDREEYLQGKVELED